MDTFLSEEIVGLLAAALTIASYLMYFRGIVYHGTVPHAVTWFAWALFGGIAFAGQVLGNGGAGAWATGLGACFCLVISVVGIWRGGREIRLADYGCLAFALLAIVVWKLSADPFLAVVTVTLADVIVMLPTLRKGWIRPHQETLSTFCLTAIRHVLAVIAMREHSVLTTLYPAALIASNITFVLIVLLARRVKPRQQAGRA